MIATNEPEASATRPPANNPAEPNSIRASGRRDFYPVAQESSLQHAPACLYRPPTVASAPFAQVAQLVEHATENRSVGGSIPSLGTIDFLNQFSALQLSALQFSALSAVRDGRLMMLVIQSLYRRKSLVRITQFLQEWWAGAALSRGVIVQPRRACRSVSRMSLTPPPFWHGPPAPPRGASGYRGAWDWQTAEPSAQARRSRRAASPRSGRRPARRRADRG